MSVHLNTYKYSNFFALKEKFELEKEAWFALAKQLKQEKVQLVKQLQQIKNADVEKSDLHEMYKRLEEERRYIGSSRFIVVCVFSMFTCVYFVCLWVLWTF